MGQDEKPKDPPPDSIADERCVHGTYPKSVCKHCGKYVCAPNNPERSG